MSEGKFDFIISGAGLVGCLVTLQLAKSGYKCCLIEKNKALNKTSFKDYSCLLYTSPSPRDRTRSRMPSSA